MTVKLSKQDKEYLKHLPDGEEIIAAEERLTTFKIDYQAILYWLEGACVIVGLVFLIILTSLDLMGMNEEKPQMVWNYVIRGVGIVTHFCGTVAAKYREMKLLIFVVVLGLLEKALIAFVLLDDLVAERNTQISLILRLQSIFVDATLCFLRLAFFRDLWRVEKAKKKRKQNTTTTNLSAKTKSST